MRRKPRIRTVPRIPDDLIKQVQQNRQLTGRQKTEVLELVRGFLAAHGVAPGGPAQSDTESGSAAQA